MPAFNPQNIPKNPRAQPGQALDRRKVVQGGNLADAIKQDPRMGAVFSAPIPGQSWTHAPKSVPWEKPPKFTKLKETMTWLMDQLVEPGRLKQLLGMMDAGMPIEAIARTILFAGFTQGQWTPDLAMLMYKPLMTSLIAIAHRAKLHHTPIVLHQTMNKVTLNNFKRQRLFDNAKQAASIPKGIEIESPTTPPPANGFMRKNK